MFVEEKRSFFSIDVGQLQLVMPWQVFSNLQRQEMLCCGEAPNFVECENSHFRNLSSTAITIHG